MALHHLDEIAEPGVPAAGTVYAYATNDATPRWAVKDDSGAVSKMVAGEYATQAEMETGTATNRVVAPGVQHYHPGNAKAWAKCIVTGGVPALTVSYNCTSVTDTGPGLLTVTINNDFSSANWSCNATVERAATALTVANLRFVGIRNAGQAAGTILLECWDATAVTALQSDPAAWHFQGMGDL